MKIPFKIKTFSDKLKLRRFVNCRPFITRNLKVFRQKNKGQMGHIENKIRWYIYYIYTKSYQ